MSILTQLDSKKTGQTKLFGNDHSIRSNIRK
jgi:hypothetical protein